MRRVFLLDVLTCSRSGGRRKLLAFVCEPGVVRKILAHLGLILDSSFAGAVVWQ